MNTELTQKALKELLKYDKNSGLFFWRVNRGRVKIGDKAGTYNSLGYHIIKALGVQYKGHRLAWLYVNGKFPPAFIDHINGNSKDNRIENLRPCNNSQNICNRGKTAKNASGYCGVTWDKQGGLWRSQIKKHGVNFFLGLHECRHKAAEAYNNRGKELHGEFFKPNIIIS